MNTISITISGDEADRYYAMRRALTSALAATTPQELEHEIGIYIKYRHCLKHIEHVLTKFDICLNSYTELDRPEGLKNAAIHLQSVLDRTRDNLQRAITAVADYNHPTELYHTVETIAREMYDTYCLAVGGKAYDGRPLPSSAAFFDAPDKNTQADAWRAAAARACLLALFPHDAQDSTVDRLTQLAIDANVIFRAEDPEKAMEALTRLRQK